MKTASIRWLTVFVGELVQATSKGENKIIKQSNIPNATHPGITSAEDGSAKSIPESGATTDTNSTLSGVGEDSAPEQALVLIPPEVPKAYGANRDRLNFDSAMYYDNYLVVTVDYTGMTQNQKVELRWGGATVPFYAEHTVTTIGIIEFRIPRLEVIDSIGRTVEIDYTVTLADGSYGGRSTVRRLIIDPQSLDLPAPTISIDRRTVIVRYTGQGAPQTARVRWSGVVTRETEELNVGTSPVQFAIPQAWVTENSGREVLINYTIYRGGSQRLLFSRILRQRIN